MTKELKSLLAGSALAPAVVSLTSVAQANDFRPYSLEFGGQQFEARLASYKCDIGDTESISTLRLVNCDSAELIEFEYDSVVQRLMRFKISPTDRKISSGVRAELRDFLTSSNGEEAWYRFATFLPETFPLEAKHRLVLTQWHEHIRDDREAIAIRPPLSHRLWDGRFVVTLWNAERLETHGPKGDGEILFEIPRIDRGVFYEFVYRIRWSAGDDGEIDAWLRRCPALSQDCDDGTAWQEIISYRGATGYGSDLVDFYYFKLGLYTVTDFDVPFIAYHRDYRSGATAESVGASDPVFR